MPSRKRREQASRRRNTARRQQVAKQSERTAPQHTRALAADPQLAEVADMTPDAARALVRAAAAEEGGFGAHDAALEIGDVWGHQSAIGRAAWEVADQAAREDEVACAELRAQAAKDAE